MGASSQAVLSIPELVLLWHGDDDTTGYQSAELVAEVCRIRSPHSFAEVRTVFYPYVTKPEEEIDPGALRRLRQGYEVWQARRQLERNDRLVDRLRGKASL